MDIKILSPEELLNYAQPQTELEIKLFNAALHFQEEMRDAQSELAERDRICDLAESETISDLQDEISEIKHEIAAAIEKISIDLVDDAVDVLRSIA